MEQPELVMKFLTVLGAPLIKTPFWTTISLNDGFSARRILICQRAPNPPEFAQPPLSRVKAWSSPARGYKFGCVCSYTLNSEIIACANFSFEELFSEELRKIVAIDCGKQFFESYFRAIAQTCCGSVFSCCVHGCLGQTALNS